MSNLKEIIETLKKVSIRMSHESARYTGDGDPGCVGDCMQCNMQWAIQELGKIEQGIVPLKEEVKDMGHGCHKCGSPNSCECPCHICQSAEHRTWNHPKDPPVDALNALLEQKNRVIAATAEGQKLLEAECTRYKKALEEVQEQLLNHRSDQSMHRTFKANLVALIDMALHPEILEHPKDGECREEETFDNCKPIPCPCKGCDGFLVIEARNKADTLSFLACNKCAHAHVAYDIDKDPMKQAKPITPE